MKFTDREFFDWGIEHGLYPGGHNKGFYEVHKKLAEFILTFNPKRHFDLGGGNSPLCKILSDNGIDSRMFETNLYSVELQKKLGTPTIYPADFTKYALLDFAEVITSIEVFEHISNYKLNKYIPTLSKNCKYFIFSSTPHKDTPEFDEQWGHVNIKSEFEWIKLFEANNFEWLSQETAYLQRNCIPTTWTLMFKSKAHA